MKVTTYDARGKAGSDAKLPGDLFDGTVNESVLHQVVTAQLAHARHGNAATKNRSARAGGSRKPWRQKGTGRARQGTIRAGQWTGGGRIFGPSPRTYGAKVPKAVRRLAVQSALNARALDGDLALIAALDLAEPSTKTVASLLSEIGASGSNVLLLTAGSKPNVYLSARNIPRVAVRPWGEASAYDVLWADLVLVEEGAFDAAAAEVEAPVAPVEDVEEPADEETIEASADETDADDQTDGEEE